MSECTWTKEEHESTAVECTAHGMIDAAKATRMLAEIERLQAKIRELESENNGQVPGTLTREEADAALVARGFMGLYHASNKEIRERASKAINPISGPILRAYVRGLDAQGVEAPTDAANRAAIMEAAVAPVDTCSKVLTRKDVEERLLACGMTPQTLSGIINNLQGELDTRDALGITGQETDIIRAYVQRRRDEANKVFPSEEPPTQPPQRERCKPIAGPWRQFQEGTGYSVFDDRGQCLGSVFPDVGCGKGWVWFAARPFDANANSTASDEESAKNAVREVLATWCDVTALAIPEAP